jgi:hypothetical protein
MAPPPWCSRYGLVNGRRTSLGDMRLSRLSP